MNASRAVQTVTDAETQRLGRSDWGLIRLAGREVGEARERLRKAARSARDEYRRVSDGFAFAFLVPLAMLCSGCETPYDEGSRFAGQVVEFAFEFRNSPERTAVFDYIPKYGTNQRVHVEIGLIRWCPQPPCSDEGAAIVVVERGKSGTGYRIGRAASVPEPLRVDKRGGPIRVHMRKVGGVVEVVALD